jgi:peptide/nickel transport system permease protein
MVCAFILLLIFVSALCAPWLGLADPYQGSMIRRLRHIGTPNYPLGTDELGRDMLARLVYGGRPSLVIGIPPVILAFIIGTRSVSSPVMSAASSTPGSCARSTCSTLSLPCCWRLRSPGALGAGIVNSIVSLTIVFVPQITA